MQGKGPLGNGVGPETKKEKYNDRPSREPRQNGHISQPKQDSEGERRELRSRPSQRRGFKTNPRM